jgi:hypothetical protein
MGAWEEDLWRSWSELQGGTGGGEEQAASLGQRAAMAPGLTGSVGTGLSHLEGQLAVEEALHERERQGGPHALCEREANRKKSRVANA